MVLKSDKFNEKIGHRNTLKQMLALNIVCLKCEIKIQKEMDKIEAYLEGEAESGVVL